MDFQPMSPEEMQRAMQFLLNHQAQFAADLANLTADLASLTARVDGLTANVEKLTARTDVIADSVLGLTGLVGRAVDALTAAQLRTDERVGRVESHLDAVIAMFERHLREDHGLPPS